MDAIDGGVKDRGIFFKEYSDKWYIKTFCNRKSPSACMLFTLGYLPAIILTALAFLYNVFLNKIKRPDTSNIDLNHTNVIDYKYWSTIQGIDVYCSPGTKTRYIIAHIIIRPSVDSFDMLLLYRNYIISQFLSIF